MLNISSTFVVQYEEFLSVGWPNFQAMLERAQQKNDAENQFSLPVYAMHRADPFLWGMAREMVRNLSEVELNDLAIGFANQYIERIKTAIANSMYGRFVKIDNLYFLSDNIEKGILFLHAEGVAPDYKALCSTPRVQREIQDRAGFLSGIANIGLKFLLALSPDTIENMAIKKLQQSNFNGSLIAELNRNLREMGMHVSLLSLSIKKERLLRKKGQAVGPQDWMKDYMKTRLVNVLAGHLNRLCE